MSRQRIAMIVSNGFFPDDIRVFKEATALSREFKVFVVVWDRGRIEREKVKLEQNIEVFRIKLRSSYGSLPDFMIHLPIFWILGLLLLIKLRAHVIHCHDFDTLPLGIFLKFLYPKTNLVFDSHEHYPSMISQQIPKIFEKIVAILFVSLPLIANGVIVVNNYLREYFKKCKNVAVVMNTPPLNAPNRVVLTKPDTNLFRIFYFGGLSLERGINHLIELAKTMPNIEFLIAGDGPAKVEIMKNSSKYANIEYLGWITYEKILEHIATSDVIPILYSSAILNNRIATPNKLFLAMGFGKPVIVYKDTLTECIVKRENIGLSVRQNDLNELTNAINALIDKKALYLTLSKNGISAFKTKYNWEIMEKRLLTLYKTIQKVHPEQQFM